ncbi:heme exporter protein CcmB [Bradymonas sediminis]|uniref:Heme exporter protein B n=1 Tax=Bradymonas sediminis TaxID=1548548 RepID=A0A2Z4FG88_9DELT|nr:heme exporter protein CcmB [Bradymonas sediminis]AWV87929.1 hypothetical protein DN745_00725 [Bradymonas sediminis]TDP62947.1 heme exporter protein B [Bradymonas sediminis]
MNPSFATQVTALVRKDLRRELRSGETLVTTTSFSLLLMLIFTFAFYQRDETVALVFPGILWVAIIFSGMLAIGRTFAQEQESGCLRALALIPGTQTSLYTSKLLVNLIFMGVFELALVPMLALAFSVNIFEHFGWFVVILGAGTLGFAILGTLISAMLVHNSLKDVLLPLVLFPLVVPLLIGGVKATGLLMPGGDPTGVQTWAVVMLMIDIAFLLGSFFMFRWVLSAIE